MSRRKLDPEQVKLRRRKSNLKYRLNPQNHERIKRRDRLYQKQKRERARHMQEQTTYERSMSAESISTSIIQPMDIQNIQSQRQMIASNEPLLTPTTFSHRIEEFQASTSGESGHGECHNFNDNHLVENEKEDSETYHNDYVGNYYDR